MVLMVQICFARFFTQKKGFCMKLQYAFARKVAAGFLAVAVAAAGANAFAANYTWKGGTNTATKNWATGSNWAQTAAPAIAPPDFSSVVIGPINGGTAIAPVQRTITVNSDTNEISSLEFTNNFAGYLFGGGGAVVVNGAITNNNNTLTTQGTGAASVVLRSVTLNGDTSLSGSGAPTEIFSEISGVSPTTKLTVTGNNLILDGTIVSVDISASTGSTVSLNQSPSFTNLTIGANGALGGLPGRDPGTFFGATGTGLLDLKNASTTTMAVAGASPGAGDGGSNYDAYATEGAVNFGGTLNIDWAQVGSGLFNNYTTFNLFDGSTYTGNFSTVSLAGGVAPYDTLSFTQFGTEWSTQPFVGAGGQSQWLVFQAQSGNLVVVPEPSTIVFAGLGVAMSGWTMWKKRRLSKLLAAKVA
jgi:hypothetical protein